MLLPASLTEHLRKEEPRTALRTLGFICLGLYSQYWLFMNVSGFKNPSSALACMLLTRSLLAHPYLHVNIFQVRPGSWIQPGKRNIYLQGSDSRLDPTFREPSPNHCPSPVTVGHHRKFGFHRGLCLVLARLSLLSSPVYTLLVIQGQVCASSWTVSFKQSVQAPSPLGTTLGVESLEVSKHLT